VPGRVIRIRSIDTNPPETPTRLLTRLSDAERFAKVATVVTKLYSEHLDAGTPLVAKTSWVSLIPTDGADDGFPAAGAGDASLGLGEVHDVSYDPAVLELPDAERRLAVLDWLQKHMLGLAKALDWDPQPIHEAYQACRQDRCELHKRGPAKSGPGRRFKAHAEFEIDGDGDAWSWLVVTDPAGETVAVSERRDSPPTLTAAAKILKSVRWDAGDVTWTPWTDDFAPPGQQWAGRVERLTVSG
jgi:hypothetical protein